MTYGGYTLDELRQQAADTSAITLDRDTLLSLLDHVESLQIELAEEKSTIVVVQYER